MTIVIVILICLICAAVGGFWHLSRQVKYWRDKAMAEARKRLAKDEKTTEIRRAIDRGAAKMINEKDKEIEELQDELRRKTILNARLWDQLRDLKAGDEFGD